MHSFIRCLLDWLKPQDKKSRSIAEQPTRCNTGLASVDPNDSTDKGGASRNADPVSWYLLLGLFPAYSKDVEPHALHHDPVLFICMLGFVDSVDRRRHQCEGAV